jgi:anaerobic ribonucleoside-triphosphate reductase activating protein
VSSILNIAEICPATRALGPGLRAALWVQGCPIGCPGCIAPDWIPNTPAHRLRPTEVAARLLSTPDIEGITLSGGEPMAQAAGLAEMLRSVRATRSSLHVICFSGFTYEALLRQPPASGVPDLLSQIDLLIDGPYVQALNQGDTFAGSRNQRLIPLSQRPLPGNQRWELRKLEVHIRDGAILTVGVPPKDWEADAFISSPFGRG